MTLYKKTEWDLVVNKETGEFEAQIEQGHAKHGFNTVVLSLDEVLAVYLQLVEAIRLEAGVDNE